MGRGIMAEAVEIVCGHVARTKPIRKAAVLLNALSPQTVLDVSRALGERDVHRLLGEMTRLPPGISVETILVLHEFVQIHRLEKALGSIPSEPGMAVAHLDGWAARNPRQFGRLLKGSWLCPRE